ncbi:MAG: regulatory protein TetR [Actinomycetia bacterium]|nr:regulatory protein TetR [Actinomycetes bacterium]
MSPRERARRGEGERLRHEILEAGKHLLFETGDEEAVTIRAVAKAVGVSPPSIYLHFADKQALLLAVCEDTFSALDEYIEKAVADIDDLRDELRARGKAYVQFGRGNPEQYRILFMTRPVGLGPEQPIPATGAFDHHLEAMQRAADAGLFVEGTDPVMAALTVWAGVHGITSLLIAKPTFDWPDLDVLIDQVLATLVRGLSR